VIVLVCDKSQVYPGDFMVKIRFTLSGLQPATVSSWRRVPGWRTAPPAPAASL